VHATLTCSSISIHLPFAPSHSAVLPQR
jgi:hypothetical protein